MTIETLDLLDTLVQSLIDPYFLQTFGGWLPLPALWEGLPLVSHEAKPYQPAHVQPYSGWLLEYPTGARLRWETRGQNGNAFDNLKKINQ